MLRILKQKFGEHRSALSEQCLHFGEAVLAVWRERDYDISWLHNEISPPFYDEEILFQIAGTFQQWYYIVRSISNDKTALERNSLSVLDQVEVITSLLKAIMDP